MNVGPIEKLQYLQIGSQGENDALTVEIDMTSWVDELHDRGYENPTFHVLFRPYNQSEPIVMDSACNYDDGILTWTVTLMATSYSGQGSTEIIAMNYPDNGLLKKSKTIPTLVESSISGVDGGVTPAPYDSWVASILALIAQLNNAFNAAVTEYVIQSSASYDGTPPSSGWSGTMPDLTANKGSYLWTRLTIAWSTGGTSHMYSVNYLNKDGSGIIDSVNGKTDANIILYGTNIAVSSSDSTKLDTALAAKFDAEKLVYSNSAPVSPATGTIWLKPKT